MRRPIVDLRTGDTPARERRRHAREPGDLLVTTPESLYLILSAASRSVLASVHTVISDEIHALAGVKRGAHLALSLERLSELTEFEPQRIGLSATVEPPLEAAQFLAGARSVQVVNTVRRPNLDLRVHEPVPDMEAPAPPISVADPIRLSDSSDATPVTPERGIWEALYPALLEEITAARSTIVFVNSRALAERLAQRLNEISGTELAWAHHGSVSHEKRTYIEEGLKSGEIRCIVATSTMELGIDMGSVDRVLLVESPGGAARGLQRADGQGIRSTRQALGEPTQSFVATCLRQLLLQSGWSRAQSSRYLCRAIRWMCSRSRSVPCVLTGFGAGLIWPC